MSLAERIALVNEKIAAAARQAGREPSEVTLVAATKVQTSDTIRQAIAAGVTICGENRVQEMTAHLDDDAYAGAALHVIGHLQTTKVRLVVGRVELIESVGAEHLLAAQAVGSPHVRLRGLMAIPPVAAGPDGNRPFFAKMRQLYVDIRSQMDDNKTSFDCLSMGMSGDFEDAVREGATLVRVGTALFGPRPPMHKG